MTDHSCPYTCDYPGCEFGAHKPYVDGWEGDTTIYCTGHIKSEVIGRLEDERDQLLIERNRAYAEKSIEVNAVIAERDEARAERDILQRGVDYLATNTVLKVDKDAAEAELAEVKSVLVTVEGQRHNWMRRYTALCDGIKAAMNSALANEFFTADGVRVMLKIEELEALLKQEGSGDDTE